MEKEIMENGSLINLPPGFVFCPTDEELVLHFLYSKATLLPCHHPNIIPDLDHLSLLHPWDLNGKSLSSGNEYYFFRKVKEKWATKNGYWREIGVTNPIFSGVDNKVGMKKYHVFHFGEPPHVTETNWVMHEYHLCLSSFHSSSYQSPTTTTIHEQNWSKWVLCKVYEKNKSQNCYRHDDDDDDDSGSELSLLDEVYMSLDDDLEEISMLNYINQI